MLGLLCVTPDAWVQACNERLHEVIADHAHCELKAAHNALSLVGRFGADAPEIVEPLMKLAHEEAEHFSEVRAAMDARGVSMAPPGKDKYVNSLREGARAIHHSDAHPLLDRLLIAALIEARSCERFHLLSEKLEEEALRDFYRGLMASEARHYRLFAGLAEKRFQENVAKSRLLELATLEADIVRSLPLEPKIHG